MKKLVFECALLAFLAACGTSEPVLTPTVTPSPSPFPTGTPTPPATSLPPTLTITPLLIDGTLTIMVNVRSGPGTAYASLGQLNAGGKVQVISRDPQGTWYLILYPPAPQGHGWVAAQYVTIAPGTIVPLDATPTPAGPVGRVIQRLNVRSGPATTFDSLGMLEPGGMVSLTGKNTTASWFQISYPAGPGGRGWVTAQYIQMDASASLPVLDNFGNLVTPGVAGTPSGPFLSPTPTVGPAFADGDSSTNPAIRVIFSVFGTHRFIYSSQVSSPQGDAEDWISFTPYSLSGKNARLVVSLVCTGNGMLTVEILQSGTQLSGWGSLACGDKDKPIFLPADQVYLVRLTPLPGDGLQLVAYTLIIQNDP